MPAEVCMTINDNWGISFKDENHKSTHQLVRNLARSASLGANYLLNVGPTALGEILPVHVERLCQVGEWLRENGESIYSTRAGLIPATRECVSTRRGNIHYVHLLDYISDGVKLKGAPQSISKAELVRDGSPVRMAWQDGTLQLIVPAEQRDALNTVVKLS